MSAQAAKAAARVSQAAGRVAAKTNEIGAKPPGHVHESPVKKGARKDPELYVRWTLQRHRKDLDDL